MKRFDGPPQAVWDPAWVRERVRARGTRALHAQALRVRIRCPLLSVRKPLYAHLHAGLCARRRSLRRTRRLHRSPAAPVEAFVVGFALMTAALFWLVVISILWGER
jgi:hypothetical protein